MPQLAMTVSQFIKRKGKILIHFYCFFIFIYSLFIFLICVKFLSIIIIIYCILIVGHCIFTQCFIGLHQTFHLYAIEQKKAFYLCKIFIGNNFYIDLFGSIH